MTLTCEQAKLLIADAEVLYSNQQIQHTLDQLASELNIRFANEYPLVLALMSGAMIFAGQLLPRLTFPLEFDYVHGSRYGHKQTGGEMRWKVPPSKNVENRIVLALDDILDEGLTLLTLREQILALGAKQFYSIVLADKQHGKSKPITADFVGLSLPNRFVFGYGMDVQGAWRNLPAIYAMKEN